MALDHFTTLCKWEHGMGFLVGPTGKVLNIRPSSCLEDYWAPGVLDTRVARISHYKSMRNTTPITWTGRIQTRGWPYRCHMFGWFRGQFISMSYNRL